MIIELDDPQKKLLLETLAMAHMVEYLKGNYNSALDNIIQRLAEALKKEGNEHIFFSVFNEVKL